MHSQDKKRLIIICGVFIALTLVVLCTTIILVMRANPNQSQATSVTVSGEVTCLPKLPSDYNVTAECAIGLHGDDNRYYALSDLPQSDTWHTGDRVNISGTLTTGSFNNYDTAGLIRVKNIGR